MSNFRYSSSIQQQFDAMNAELAPAQVETATDTLRDAIDDMIRLRVDRVSASVVARHEAQLLSCLASLQFLCTDIRVERDNAARSETTAIHS